MADTTGVDGRRVGVLKTAAKRIGLSLDAYLSRRASGEKWCHACSAWHGLEAFRTDRSRGDGRTARCVVSRRGRRRGKRAAAHERARYVVNLAVRYGRLPRANDVPCTDCGHVWAKGERRHEYDHHLGYEPAHHLDVEPVCTICHADREKGRRNG